MNEIDLCYKNECIQAKGDVAKQVAVALSIALVLFGIAAIIKASN